MAVFASKDGGLRPPFSVMPCFHPIACWQRAPGEKPVFSMRNLSATHELIYVPCGRCIGCRLEHSRKWAMRCMMEASMHEDNSFITLTYDEEHLPVGRSLVPRDLQLFLKRLRKAVDVPIRFFACGEYGELNQRPHYHAIIFGYQFGDREPWIQKPLKKLKKLPSIEVLSNVNTPDVCESSADASVVVSCYWSPLLASLWPYGFSSVGDCTFESAAYVARYCLKKITGKKADEYYRGRVPEFVRMSNRPGIAAGWFQKYGTDVYPSDKCFARGVPCKPPRYFDKLFCLTSPEEFAKIKAIRKTLNTLMPSEENSPERLETREELMVRQLARNTHRSL